jgi:hypothetical protein
MWILWPNCLSVLLCWLPRGAKKKIFPPFNGTEAIVGLTPTNGGSTFGFLTYVPYAMKEETYSGAAGWGTLLQAGRWWVRFPVASLGFFIYVILLTALWLWAKLSPPPGNSTTFSKTVKEGDIRGALRRVKVSIKSTEVYWDYEKTDVTESALGEVLVCE